MLQVSDQSDLVRLLGDILTELDFVRSSPQLNNDQKDEIDGLRDRIDAVQLRLVRDEFAADTAQVIDATAKVKEANSALRKTIKKVEKFATSMETVGKIASIVERLVGIAAAV